MANQWREDLEHRDPQGALRHDLARTSGKLVMVIHYCFLTPTNAEGFKVEEMLWTFNMPTDHGRISLSDVYVDDSAIFGGEGRGLQVVQHFFNENRIRQAASSLGAAQFCINESVEYAMRKPFGKPLLRTRASSSHWRNCKLGVKCPRLFTKRHG